MKQMTYQEFLDSARLTHFDALSQGERDHATNYDGKEVVVFAGGHAICKEGDQYWWEDYKERFTGSWEEITRQFYDFCIEEGSLFVQDGSP
jgi:hypothetical protein